MNIKKLLYTLSLGLMTVFVPSSCVDDDWVKTNDVVEGVPITVTLKLSGAPVADVAVETRASGDDLSSLYNLAIIIYDRNGNFQQIVGTTEGSLTWEPVDGTGGTTYSVKFSTTSGEKKLLAVGNRGGGFWETGEEIESEISQMKFDKMKDYLLSAIYTMQNDEIGTPFQIVSDDQMLISGWNEGIVFDENGGVQDWGQSSSDIAVKMKRTLAHVTFKIPSNNTTKANGNKVTFVPTSYKVYNVPVKSLLANMYNKPTPVQQEGDDESGDVVVFKNFASTNIVTADEGFYSFSFYMPENVYNDIDKIATYNEREAWDNSKVGSSASEKQWTYAPPTSTFVVISGAYTEVDANGDAFYTGNVQYTIHLGDFDEEIGYGNFSIERNCSYTYNVFVNGVDKIVVEAKKEGEGQNGAEGQIYSYKGSTYAYNLDAHYEQVYLEYNLSSIADEAYNAVQAAIKSGTELSVEDAIANNLILVIQSEAMDYTANTKYYTTRNKRGTLKPYKVYIDGLAGKEGASKDEVLNGEGTGNSPKKGFDYKWVEMWPQGEETLANYPGVSTWSKENLLGMNNNTEVVYGGNPAGDVNRLIDVYDAIVAMGKAVKEIYQNKYENGANDITIDQINIDKIWIVFDDGSYKARFTAFINEYYYYKHPLTGAEVTSWSVFVNKIPREMIIAMSSDVSLDGNSSVSQAYSYISQLSMQTPYSDRNDVVMSAFGLETYNETPINWSHSSNVFSGTRGEGNNLTSGNGRVNQLAWLGETDRKWANYITHEYNGYLSSNSTVRAEHKLENAYASKLYSNACMSRNRDLNGDGQIQDNEVRWYLASVNEYLRMGLASQALSSASQLYFGGKSEMTYAGYPSSEISNGAIYYTSSGTTERVYWAVEKGAWGTANNALVSQTTPLPIRCVRILPAVGDDSKTDMTNLDDVVPEPFYKSHTVDGNTVLEFKDRMVAGMFRTRTDEPLTEHTEDDPANRFSEGIVVASVNFGGNYTDWGVNRLYNVSKVNGITYPSGYEYWNDNVIITNETKIDPCSLYYHEDNEKWRVPNLSELVMMMRDACDSGWSASLKNVTCCTQFSNSNVRLGFRIEESVLNCTVADYNATYKYWSNLYSFNIRCVRDVPAGYTFPTN